MVQKEILTFKCKVIRSTFISENYKMYAVEVNEKDYPKITFKHTIYGNILIAGNIHELIPDCEYEIEATEKYGKKGYLYEVSKIRKTEIKSEEDMFVFLQEILTVSQACELYKYYPNVINMVMDGTADKEVDLNKLHGIGNVTWERIKTKIIENFALYDLVTFFKGTLSMTILKKIYDKYTSIEKVKHELRIRPYSCLCSLSRVGFLTADALLLGMERDKIFDFGQELKTSKDRCLACIEYHLEENETNGNTRMDLLELQKLVRKQVPACADKFAECLKENTDRIFYSVTSRSVALASTYDIELKISNIILDVTYNHVKWDIDWKSYQNKGEFPLTDEQIGALHYLNDYSISVLCGFGGSGKTQTTNTIIEMLEENDKTYVLCSPTGRAGKVLASYTHRKASTIHIAMRDEILGGWYNAEMNNAIDTDCVIVDECSMTDVFLFYSLLKGIDFSRTKLLIVGDPAQLCSVGAGLVLKNLIDSGRVPVTTLTRIFRYNEGGLMQIATNTRNNEITIKKADVDAVNNGWLKLGKDYNFKQCTNENLVKYLSLFYEKILQTVDVTDIMVLTSTNKGDYGTVTINKVLQQVSNKNYGSSTNVEHGENVYYEDDIIIQTTNNYHASVYDETNIKDYTSDAEAFVANGETGRITKIIDSNHIIIDFDGIKVVYRKADFEHVSLGYCISVHKSQGGSAKIVIFLTPSSHTFMLSSNLIYVGLTRTKEKCYHFGDITAFNRAVKKNETTKRMTFLYDMLLENPI